MDPELYGEWSEVAVVQPPLEADLGISAYEDVVENMGDVVADVGEMVGYTNWREWVSLFWESVVGQFFHRAMGLEAVLSIIMTAVGLCIILGYFVEANYVDVADPLGVCPAGWSKGGGGCLQP